MTGNSLVPDAANWLALEYSDKNASRCIPYDEGHDCESRVSKCLMWEDPQVKKEYRGLSRSYSNFVNYLAHPEELQSQCQPDDHTAFSDSA